MERRNIDALIQQIRACVDRHNLGAPGVYTRNTLGPRADGKINEYGVADAAAQNGRIEKLYIVDFNLNKLKEYTVENGYISDAQIESDGVLKIWRRKADHSSGNV